MLRMSVSLTVDSVIARYKTVTRRHVDTWKNLKAGDQLTLIEKGMGLPKGSKQIVVAEVEVVSVEVIRLWPIGWGEIKAEGLLERARYEVNRDPTGDASYSKWFCRFWLEGHGYRSDADPAEVMCRRIEWRYLPTSDGAFDADR